MEYVLQREEAELLQTILTNYLSDLRMEICGTDSYAMRESLKREEEMVKGIVARLEPQETLTGS